MPYLILGLTDYHEFHVIKITEKCANVVGHTRLSPVSHHQDKREICQCCWSYLIITEYHITKITEKYAHNVVAHTWSQCGRGGCHTTTLPVDHDDYPFAFLLLFVGIKIIQKSIISNLTSPLPLSGLKVRLSIFLTFNYGSKQSRWKLLCKEGRLESFQVI